MCVVAFALAKEKHAAKHQIPKVSLSLQTGRRHENTQDEGACGVVANFASPRKVFFIASEVPNPNPNHNQNPDPDPPGPKT